MKNPKFRFSESRLVAESCKAGQTLGKIIRHFKAKATKRIHDARFGFQWQSKFHDRIIRNDDELDRIRNYIRNNPLHWHDDEENPDRNRDK